MKKRARLTSLASLAICSLAFLSGCAGGAEIAGIRMSNPEVVNIAYGIFSYDNINVTVEFKNGSTKEIPLTEDMISEVERLKFFKIGKQDIQVVFRNRYSTIMPVSVNLNTFKDSYALVGYECTYDGEPHAVGLNQELPAGATITYPKGNIFINAGTYEIIGVMEKNGYASKTLTTTLVIHQAERETKDIVFEGATYTYDGEAKSVEAKGVPEGVTPKIEYIDTKTGFPVNKVVNAGIYTATCRFEDSSPNYESIPERKATIIIERAKYDISNIKLEDATKTFDGQNYEAKLVNEKMLPSGVTLDPIIYRDAAGEIVTSNADVGEYTMTAHFKCSDTFLRNYEPLPDLTAKLTVAKKIIKISDKITFEGKSVNFDETKTHSLAVEGLPNGVIVTYENNDKVYAGEYEVIAHFSTLTENEATDIASLSAYLTINPVRRSVKVLDDATGEYTKDFSQDNIKINGAEASVVGYDPSVFRVVSIEFYSILNTEVIKPADLVDGTTYKYLVTFEYLDENLRDSVILSQESDNFVYHED